MKATKKVSNVYDEIQEEHGDVFVSAESVINTPIKSIPISLSLDIATRGGFALGTSMSLSGVSGSGKSSLALQIIKNAQDMGMTCIYVDAEGRLSPSLLKTIKGLNVDNLKIIRSPKGSFLTAENNLNIIYKILSSEPNVLIVIDSVATLCPESDHTAESGETTKRANIAGIMYAFIRKVSQILPSMGSNIIYISHVQANPSGYGGPQEMGGNAIKYSSSYRLQCLSSSEVPKDEEKKTGRESIFKVFKSALGPGTGAGKYYMKYNNGYNREADIFNLAMETGIIGRKGAWYNFNDDKEEVKLQGEDSVIQYLIDNPKCADRLEDEIRKMAL